MMTTLLKAEEAISPDAIFGEQGTAGRKIFIGIQASLALIAFVIYYTNRAHVDYLEPVPMLLVLGTLVAVSQALYHLTSLRPVEWLSADLLFVVGFYVVHFGYPLLWCLDWIGQTKMNIWWRPEYVPRSMCLSIIGLASFCIGFNLVRMPSRLSAVPLAFDEGVLRFWKRFGMVLIIPAFIVFLVFQVLYYGDTASYGEAFRSRGGFGVASIMYQFATIFLRIGLAFSLVSAFLLRKEFRPGVLAVTMWIMAGLAYMVQGDRLGSGLVMLTGLVAFSSFHRRIGLPWLLGMAVLAGAVFGAAGVARHIAFGSVGGLASVLQEQFDPLSGYAELTGSFRTVVVAIDVRNEHGLFYGATWIAAILGIVPFGGQALPEFVQAAVYGKGYWISQILDPGNQTNSAGTTVIAASYLDFGVLGVIGFSLLVGWLAAVYRKKAATSGSIGWAVGYVGLAATLAGIARFEYHYFLRVAIWPLIMAAIASQCGISSRFMWPANSKPPEANPQS